MSTDVEVEKETEDDGVNEDDLAKLEVGQGMNEYG